MGDKLSDLALVSIRVSLYAVVLRERDIFFSLKIGLRYDTDQVKRHAPRLCADCVTSQGSDWSIVCCVGK